MLLSNNDFRKNQNNRDLHDLEFFYLQFLMIKGQNIPDTKKRHLENQYRHIICHIYLKKSEIFYQFEIGIYAGIMTGIMNY